jgi:hypothetical protein
VTSDRPIAPVELNDKIPLALSKLVMECCRDKPADRPADMKQLIARLAVVQKLWKRHREAIRAERQSGILPQSNHEDKTSVEDQP